MKRFFITLHLVILIGLNIGSLHAQAPTYFEHIAPIIYKNCVQCHSKGQIAPFPLTTYQETIKKAKTIQKVTKIRYMPPWHADVSYTKLAHANRLTDKEIETIAKWVDANVPMGDSLKKPDLSKYMPKPLPTPDYVLNVPKIPIKGNNTDQFFYVKVPFQFPNPVDICRCEFVPGNKKLVHHVNGFLYNMSGAFNPYTGNQYVDSETFKTLPELLAYLGLKNTDGSFPDGSNYSVVDYFPGALSVAFPAGIGRKITFGTKGAILLNTIHYGDFPIDQADESKIYLYKCKENPKREVFTYSFGSPDFIIEPELEIKPNKIQTHKTWLQIKNDVSMLTIQPHAHMICKSLKAYAKTSSGNIIPLLNIPKWDFRWQRVYKFKYPIRIPAGSNIYLEGVYDNTANNPNNPFSPPRLIKESQKTKDEMLQLYIQFMAYQKGDETLDLENLP